MAALLDTSAIVASVDRTDEAHARVVAALAAERAPILLPIVALPEVAYLIQERHGAARSAAVMTRIIHGSWPIVSLEAADLERTTELMARYADAAIGFVDAGIAALAERLAVVRIHTLDRRDFSILRPRHIPAFEIVPGP